MAAELVLCLQRETTASTTTSPPRPPHRQIQPPCPNNMRRPLLASSSCHVLQARTGHAFGLAASNSACIRRPRPLPPWHSHPGLGHDGKHMLASLQARASRLVAHLKPQTSSLTRGRSGGVAVAGEAGFARRYSRNSTFCSIPPHTTRNDKIAVRALQISCRAPLVCISTCQCIVVASTDKARQTAQASRLCATTPQPQRYFVLHTTTHHTQLPSSTTTSFAKLWSYFGMYFNTSKARGGAH